ncbi:MAG: hypothetical protein LBQ31_08780 [Bacteroidales bacterium]|jgi:hypothetical protein|nr:hypothetical protein [Bacteroidales bacterium]
MATITLQFDAKNSLAKSIIQSIKSAGVFNIIEEKSPYSKPFTDKIQESEKQFALGEYETIKTSDLWK